MIYHKALSGLPFHGEALASAPPDQSPPLILDVGSSTARWAQETAWRRRDAIVYAIDLTPTTTITSKEHRTLFPNLHHLHPINLLTSTSPVKSETISLVNLSLLLGHVRSWETLFRSTYRCLFPGQGRLQFVDIDWELCCEDDDKDGEDMQSYRNWWSGLKTASRLAGKPLQYPSNVRRLLEDTGFVDVEETVVKIRFDSDSASRTSARERAVADWFQAAMMSDERDLLGMCLALFTRVFGMARVEVEEECRGVLGAMRRGGRGRFVRL